MRGPGVTGDTEIGKADSWMEKWMTETWLAMS